MHAHPPASPQSSSYARGTSGSNNSRFAIDRVVKPKLLDFEYALWQMRLLLSQGPKKIYRHASYRKQTKNQWARDDPTFCVLSCAFVAIVAIGYCFAYERRGESDVGGTLGGVFRLRRVRMRHRDAVLVFGE